MHLSNDLKIIFRVCKKFSYIINLLKYDEEFKKKEGKINERNQCKLPLELFNKF